MPAILDLTLKPGADAQTGKAQGLYRDDPYDRVLHFRDANNVAIDMTGSYTAEIRKARLPDATDPTPLATFDVDTSDAVNGNIAIHLDRAVTKALELKASETGFWDIQDEGSGVTFLAGKVKIYDDVSRPV